MRVEGFCNHEAGKPLCDQCGCTCGELLSCADGPPAEEVVENVSERCMEAILHRTHIDVKHSDISQSLISI